MGDLESQLKKLNLSSISREIEKGSIIRLQDDDAEKQIKDKFNRTPYFISSEFRKNNQEKYGYSSKHHYWIFLKTYQKRGNSGKVKIAIRSSFKEDRPNNKQGDLFQQAHLDIDSNHNICDINKDGLWKAELPRTQKLNKNFLKELDPTSENFICIDPETEKIVNHFAKLDEVYD